MNETQSPRYIVMYAGKFFGRDDYRIRDTQECTEYSVYGKRAAMQEAKKLNAGEDVTKSYERPAAHVIQA